MKTLTIALQNEMAASIKDGVITIEIPDTCKRDLWEAQLEMWLENDVADDDKILSIGKSKFLRVINGRLK